MKYIMIVVLSLVSSTAMADGFRCAGEGFRVKLYNQVRPELGTKNPAAFIVYHEDVGTVATLFNEEIEAEYTDETVIYEGQSNSKLDGRFVYVGLEVAKKAETSGEYAGDHLARLMLNADGRSHMANLVCRRYLKGERR